MILEKHVYATITPKVNHYTIKCGKLQPKQSEAVINNYRWVPTTLHDSNRPNKQDYYEESVKRLELQLQNLKKQIREKQMLCGNNQHLHEQIRMYRLTISHLQNKVRNQQYELQVKQNQLRMKEMELLQKNHEINRKNQQLLQKDNLIQYQLSVVDRLIEQIEQRQQEENQKEENQQEGENENSFDEQNQQVNEKNVKKCESASQQIEFKSICSRLSEQLNQEECLTPKKHTLRQNSTISFGSSAQNLESHRSTDSFNSAKQSYNIKQCAKQDSQFLNYLTNNQTKITDPAAGSLNGITKLISKLF